MKPFRIIAILLLAVAINGQMIPLNKKVKVKIGPISLIHANTELQSTPGIVYVPDTFGCDYYAAALGEGGSSSGNGTDGNPWDLQTALNKTSELNGKILGVRGGHYTGKFISNLTNATIRGIRGEFGDRPIIDGYVATTLVGDIPTGNTGSVVSFTVTDASAIKALYDIGAIHTVLIDGEGFYLPEGGITGNTISGARGAAGTCPADMPTQPAHTSGASVRAAGNQFQIAGANTTVWGLEITNTDPLRDWAIHGGEGLRGAGIAIPSASGTKIINCYIHDTLNGIFTGSDSSNTELYGNVVYNNGQFDSRVGHETKGAGHGLYLENSAGFSKVHNNISINSFALGCQLFGVTATYVGGDLQGNFFANSGTPLGAGIRHWNLSVGPDQVRLADVLIKDNVFGHPHNVNAAYNVQFGYGAGADNGHVIDNYFIGGGALGIEYLDTTTKTHTGNKHFSTNTGHINIQSEAVAATVNNNTYYATQASNDNFPKFGNLTTHANETFVQWQANTGYDANSICTTANMPQTVIIRPNAYETGRANIYVLAPTGNSVTIGLSQTGLPINRNYIVKNAFDINGANVVTGVYDSGNTTVTLPLTNLSVETPIAGTPIAPMTNMMAFILVDGGAV